MTRNEKGGVAWRLQLSKRSKRHKEVAFHTVYGYDEGVYYLYMGQETGDDIVGTKQR